MPAQVVVSGAFDDIRARDLRFLDEASKAGPLTVVLWSDSLVAAHTGRPPKFPLYERRYFLEAVRCVGGVFVLDTLPGGPATLPQIPGFVPDFWVVRENQPGPEHERYCRDHGIDWLAVPDELLTRFPESPVPRPDLASRKRIVVTGCFDWFHSGHVRFLEEVSGYGDVFVVVGNDANVRELKGEGHPLLTDRERCYIAGSIRHVTQALVSTGMGWLDAEPEIALLRPDIYVVNEDGDKGGKRDFCEQNGIEYLVLRRTPAPGLPRRSSTDLRGF